MDKEQPRSIRFPQWLWDAIDRDALQAKRSAVKQMEVVLTAYYRGEASEVNIPKLQKIAKQQDAVQEVDYDIMMARMEGEANKNEVPKRKKKLAS